MKVLTRETVVCSALPPAVMCLWLGRPVCHVWPVDTSDRETERVSSSPCTTSQARQRDRESVVLYMHHITGQQMRGSELLDCTLTPKQPPVGPRVWAVPGNCYCHYFSYSTSHPPPPCPVIDLYLPGWLHQTKRNVVLILSKFPLFFLTISRRGSQNIRNKINKISFFLSVSQKHSNDLQ